MKSFFELFGSTETSPNLLIQSVSENAIGSYSAFKSSTLLRTNTDSLNWRDIYNQFRAAPSPYIEYDGGQYFCESITNNPNLIICGAGHVSMPIIKIAKMVGFCVTAIDDRPSFIGNAVEAGADNTICNSFDKALAALPAASNSYYVIVTRGHKYDKTCLMDILTRASEYIGVMSSKARVSILRSELKKEGIPAEAIEKISSPIGIKINSETPEEIAVSIIAEIIQRKNSIKRSFGFPQEFLGDYNTALSSGAKMAICTIIGKRGSAPRDLGAKMIVTSEGFCYNTIGGGCLEADIKRTALNVMESGKPQRVQVNMTLDQAEE